MISIEGFTSWPLIHFIMDGLGAQDAFFGSNFVQNELQSHQKRVPPDTTTSSHRHRPISVLFIHRDADVVDACQEELKKAGFGLSADLVLTMAQCTEQLRSQRFDMVIAEYPSPNWNGAEAF